MTTASAPAADTTAGVAQRLETVTSPATTADDAEARLLECALAARDGDVGAFAELYDACAPAVYRFCLARTRNAADAEDLLQGTFLRVVEALPRYEDRGLPFRAWLFRVCRSVSIDAHRRRRQHEPLDACLELVRPMDDWPGSDATDRLADVLDAIGSLTADQRQVIQLRFFADLSAREAGLVMGRDEAAVRALQARAITSLRRRLAVHGRPGQLEAAPT